MKRIKLLIITLISAMVLSLGSYSFSFAASVSDKKSEMSDIQSQQSELSGTLSELKSQLDEQQKAIDEVQKKVNGKQAEIDQTEAKISETEQQIKERKDGLNNRLRTMYKNGSIGYLDILLGSNNISEFFSNFEMVQKIYQNDQTTLNTLRKQEADLNDAKETLKGERAELNEEKSKLEEKKTVVDNTRAKMQKQYDELDAELDKLASEIADLEAAANQQSSGSVPNKYSGGQFKWPCNSTIITSWFGNRPASDTNGIGSTNHGGIDIGASYGSPIYACADGTVTLASWYGGYGNCVMIAHGSGLTTLYGHCSSLAVSSGQRVKKGQVIAYIGSTGNSTGPHLHLSVFSGGSPVDPMNYF